jgi:hypothetical protein
MHLPIAASGHIQVTRASKVQHWNCAEFTLDGAEAAREVHSRTAMPALQNCRGLAAKVVGTI